MSAPDHSRLLLEAFVLPPAQATDKWRRWRETLDLDRLDAAYFQMLPMMAHRLDAWLTDDPARQVIQGICKRAWTHNQMAFRSLVTIGDVLREAGVAGIVVTGSAAWALLYSENKAIRPIDSLELLVRRGDAALAIEVLHRAGWSLAPGLPRPEGQVFDNLEGVWLHGGPDERIDERIKISWRLLPCAAELAADRETLGSPVPIEIQGIKAHILPPEEMLLHALAGHRESYQVDWRWDALALLAARPVDWARMTRLLDAESIARRRLSELHEDWRITIPSDVLKQETSWWRRRFDAVWRDYRWHAWRAGAR